MCVGRQNQQLRETESLLDRPTVRLMSLNTTFESTLKLIIHVI